MLSLLSHFSFTLPLLSVLPLCLVPFSSFLQACLSLSYAPLSLILWVSNFSLDLWNVCCWVFFFYYLSQLLFLTSEQQRTTTCFRSDIYISPFITQARQITSLFCWWHCSVWHTLPAARCYKRVGGEQDQTSMLIGCHWIENVPLLSISAPELFPWQPMS